MQILISTSIIIGTLAAMEVFSWLIHKYLFHGLLWFIHRSHQQPHRGWSGLNDVFSLIFVAISLCLIWNGRKA